MSSKKRPPMPDRLREIALAANEKRHPKRMAVPMVVPKPEQRHLQNLTCPYRKEDEELWLALLVDCFGTRVFPVAQCFIRHLEKLCPEVLYDGEEHCRRDEETLALALSIVAGIKPRNEMEAAAAAQYVALHLTAMRLGANCASGSGYLDSKSAHALAAVTKAAALQYATIQSGRGKRRSIKQTFIVKKETRYYDNRQVHLGEGGGNPDARVHEADELRAHARGTVEPQELPALPCPEQSAEVLRFPSGEGAESLPQARRGERIRRAESGG